MRQHKKCADQPPERLVRGRRLAVLNLRRNTPQQKSVTLRGASAATFKPLHRGFDRTSARRGGQQQRHRAKEKPGG